MGLHAGLLLAWACGVLLRVCTNGEQFGTVCGAGTPVWVLPPSLGPGRTGEAHRYALCSEKEKDTLNIVQLTDMVRCWALKPNQTKPNVKRGSGNEQGRLGMSAGKFY